MKLRFILKLSAIAMIMGIGVYSVTSAPEAVESFLPAVSTVSLSRQEYSESISAAGMVEKLSSDWYVTVAVGESDIRKVAEGQKAKLSGAAFDSDRYTAEVISIADKARQQTTLTSSETVVDVTLKIDNPDEYLRSGYTAAAAIEVSEPKTIYTLPYDVICQDDSGEYVYVLRGSNVVRCGIETGAEFENGTEIKSGLYLSDKIITSAEAIAENSLAKAID